MKNTIDYTKFYNSEYFRIQKFLQMYVGLWPYNYGPYKYIGRSLELVILVAAAVPHFNAVSMWCGKSLGMCTENAAGIVYTCGTICKYSAALFKQEKLSKVYETVADFWLSIDDPDEKVIMTEWAKLGKLKAILYIVYLVMATVVFTQLGMLPVVLDIIMPLNQSRERLAMVNAEYFVSMDDHYYQIYTFYCFVGVVNIPLFMAIDTTYTVVIHQMLAVFSVIKYRLKIATDFVEKDKDFAYNKIKSAIKLHQKVIEFNSQLEDTYDMLFFLLIFMCSSFLCLAAVATLENANNIIDILRMTMFEIGVLVHLFYLSWPGQLVIDESEGIYWAIYNNEWYNITPEAKTLMKIMMLRCLKPCCLTAAGLYVMNFENYGAILKSTVSYITVLLSFRE